jgi:hypothetical protein
MRQGDPPEDGTEAELLATSPRPLLATTGAAGATVGDRTRIEMKAKLSSPCHAENFVLCDEFTHE